MSRWLLYAVAGTLLGFWPWWIDYLPLNEVAKGRPAGQHRIKELLNESFDSGPCDSAPARPQVIEQPSAGRTPEQDEDLRSIQEEWKRIWEMDNPSHLPPERIKGGIQ